MIDPISYYTRFQLTVFNSYISLCLTDRTYSQLSKSIIWRLRKLQVKHRVKCSNILLFTGQNGNVILLLVTTTMHIILYTIYGLPYWSCSFKFMSGGDHRFLCSSVLELLFLEFILTLSYYPALSSTAKARTCHEFACIVMHG